MASELLGLHPPGVGNEQCPVVGDKLFLQLHSAVRILVLGVVGNNGLGDGLTDSVNLRGVSTTLDTDTDVNDTESVLAGGKDGLVDLESEDLRLEEVEGRAVNVDEATTLLSVGNRGSGLGIQEWLVYRNSTSKLVGVNIPSFCRKFGRP